MSSEIIASSCACNSWKLHFKFVVWVKSRAVCLANFLLDKRPGKEDFKTSMSTFFCRWVFFRFISFDSRLQKDFVLKGLTTDAMPSFGQPCVSNGHCNALPLFFLFWYSSLFSSFIFLFKVRDYACNFSFFFSLLSGIYYILYYILYVCPCVRVYVCVSGQNLTTQFVKWQPGIFKLVVISGCHNPLSLAIYFLFNNSVI